MPVNSAKPMHVEVLADVTPSDYFHGSYDFYQLYLRGALPLFKAFTQLSVHKRIIAGGNTGPGATAGDRSPRMS